MAYVSITSDLKRKAWMREGLLQKAAQSFWAPYSGQDANSIVVQVNNENAAEGHTVVFDYDGNLASKAIKGKDTAFGKGETKKKFSNKVTVERYRLVADNGDAFDAVDIGDLSLSQHSDSRSKLADLFVRFKDQAIFDTLQGLHINTPTHIIDLSATFDYNILLDLETDVKTAKNFSTGSAILRAPLTPFKLQNGEAVWLMVVDPLMANKLRKSAGYQAMVYQADVRGNENRAITGVVGKIGSLIIVQAPQFFGQTDSAAATFGLDATATEISGLRLKDANNLWSGQTGYDATTDQISRSFILGANAVQLAFGKMPDYKFQESPDFAIKSESALEVWMEAQKTLLVAEAEDYKQAKMAGYDWGVVAVDCKTIDV